MIKEKRLIFTGAFLHAGSHALHFAWLILPQKRFHYCTHIAGEITGSQYPPPEGSWGWTRDEEVCQARSTVAHCEW